MVEPLRISFHQQSMAPSSTEGEVKPPRYLTRFHGKTCCAQRPVQQRVSMETKTPWQNEQKKPGAGVPFMGKRRKSTQDERRGIPWKINMEPTNHPFRKENDLPNLHDYVPIFRGVYLGHTFVSYR